MAVTNFPTNTEILTIESSSYNAGTNTATGYNFVNNEKPVPASKFRGWLKGVQQLISWLKSDSPQLTQEAWNAPTLLNSWANFGGTHAPAGYFKDSNGVVHLRGLVSGGTIGTTAVIFTLPLNYRPAFQEIFVIRNGAGSGIAEVRIQPNGEVIAYSGADSWWSLAGITFKAA
jgi:hypothetical protein